MTIYFWCILVYVLSILPSGYVFYVDNIKEQLLFKDTINLFNLISCILVSIIPVVNTMLSFYCIITVSKDINIKVRKIR